MYARSKQTTSTPQAMPDPARRINITNLKGDNRTAMWTKIQAEHPALAEDLQGGACKRIREAFPDIAVIVSLNANNQIMKGRG